MKRLTLFIACQLPFLLHAQIASRSVEDAFLITRMAAKFHVQPKPVDDEFSNHIYTSLLKSLDENRLFFTRADIAVLEPFRLQIDDQIKNRKADFLNLLTKLYQVRLQQASDILDNLAKKPFNFSLPETFTTAEDSSYPADTAEMRIKIYKTIKAQTLANLTTDPDVDTSIVKNKRLLDSTLLSLCSKNQKIYKRSISEMLESPKGIAGAVGDAYCETIATGFDPHTEYFPLTKKENFESQLGNKSFLFGFSLSANRDNNAVINDLVPGSPAFKCGSLNKGDILLSIQWENKQPIDLSGASSREINTILGASNHNKATFNVKKADGSVREVVLVKEIVNPGETGGDAVNSFMLNGEKKIGFISLPAFYTSWEDNNEQGLGCAGDVAQEIIKLKKEGIQGLIIDLRYNGGGSMQEAVALAGIFIDGGPVAQVKDKEGKAYTLKDVNRGTVYDGPLVILVNGYSASASEMLAGTLQDYNRAVIVGTNTYGKATAQVVLPLDTAVNLTGSKAADSGATSFLKVTVSQLYRITGKTAQLTGVIPDINLPDALEVFGERESNDPAALTLPDIDGNKYYKPYAVIQKDGLLAEAKKDMSANKYFDRLQAFSTAYKKSSQPENTSLNVADAIAKIKMDKNNTAPEMDNESKTPGFSIENTSYETERMLADNNLKEQNTSIKKYMQKDPYLGIAFNLLLLMNK